MASLLGSDRVTNDAPSGSILHADRNLTATAALATALVAIFGGLAILVVGVRLGFGAGELLRDPAATQGYAPIVGLISHLGAFAMLVTAAICLFAAPHAREGRLLAQIGLFSAYFMLDDFFMLHEHVLPGAGIPEEAALALLALMAAVIFLANWRVFFSVNAAGLWLAGVLLAASVVVDVLLPDFHRQVIVEDLLKFAGIAVWSAFWLVRAFLDIGERIETGSA